MNELKTRCVESDASDFSVPAFSGGLYFLVAEDGVADR